MHFFIINIIGTAVVSAILDFQRCILCTHSIILNIYITNVYRMPSAVCCPFFPPAFVYIFIILKKNRLPVFFSTRLYWPIYINVLLSRFSVSRNLSSPIDKNQKLSYKQFFSFIFSRIYSKIHIPECCQYVILIWYIHIYSLTPPFSESNVH